ncbi:Dor1-like family-domain-containing protein [Mycotypha africana]|uniref:Dor1-like family-domain-containing protein n=1 Tax=Mycotypha africana TaxID=64632 RepID=UPI0023009DE1|nr:Dor1-like family-domain-containing protein [Mycotypha africana]KAI8971642.1 Dor1-like family-domain-containing protein [Mycotypha africana]
MDTCVWNGYYSEAMDLASQMRLLYVRYPLPIIKSIQDQVQTSSDLMLIQLISHLRKPIRLAAAMNVIGFLRRMDIFKSENEIRMIFLRCRDDYLLQKLARIRRDISDDPRQRSTETFEYLKRFIDVMREQMFEIGTQYVSIFPNEQGTLLSDYMIHIVEHIKHILKTHLHMIEDTSALNSLLTQLQYCGMSLGRIGLDFRHIFVDSFEEVIQPIIINFINASTDEFISKITKATEELSVPNSWMCSRTITASAGSVQEQVQPSNEKTQDEEEVNEEGQGEGGAEASTMKKQTFQPPMLLVNYPPLAIFTNNILSAFNALRLLPAISLYEPIQCHLEECLS